MPNYCMKWAKHIKWRVHTWIINDNSQHFTHIYLGIINVQCSLSVAFVEIYTQRWIDVLSCCICDVLRWLVTMTRVIDFISYNENTLEYITGIRLASTRDTISWLMFKFYLDMGSQSISWLGFAVLSQRVRAVNGGWIKVNSGHFIKFQYEACRW